MKKESLVSQGSLHLRGHAEQGLRSMVTAKKRLIGMINEKRSTTDRIDYLGLGLLIGQSRPAGNATPQQ
ncbi:hypothetical protein LQT98_18940 [Chromobacterium aquaticum]|uniref:hypothetical protein n=1 Tax=Chromobacterium aquaticum TaxID=467180 RepID=UPI001E3D828E|nr:hypothetical protein [Chromobacterium aquaticum]MCD5363755.1 hypothetical protein [Chromobacterium aquaticum]